jgi:hypothetical protein
VSTGSEADHLVRIVQVGLAFKVFAFKPAQVGQHRFWGGLAREW